MFDTSSVTDDIADIFVIFKPMWQENYPEMADLGDETVYEMYSGSAA